MPLNFLRLSVVGIFALVLFAPRVHAQDEIADAIIDLVKNEDKELRALAFEQIRKELIGAELTKKFAELLPTLPAGTQIGLLSALADRKDAAAAPEIRKLLAETKEESVRIAAIKALGPLGSEEDLKALLPAMASESEELRAAARTSLIALPSEVSPAMVAELKQLDGPSRVALMQILTTRRAREAVPTLLEQALAEDAAVRAAAVTALAELAEAMQVNELVGLAMTTPAGKERDAVEKAIAAVCQRIPEIDQRAEPVLTLTRKSVTDDAWPVYLSILGRIGGTEAIATVDEHLANDAHHAAAVRALCNWPDGVVVGRLLKIARTDPDAKLRTAAFQALIRIAPLADDRSDARRLETLQTVFAMCTTDPERKQVLDRAKAIRYIETLRFALRQLEHPPLEQQACLTVVELAHHSSLRESNKLEFMAALDLVIARSKDDVVKDRANRYKTGQTWVRPKGEE